MGPYFVKSLSRFSDAGTIPALSQAQLDALKILEETCARLSLHMVLAPGDIQWVSDLHVLHARTAYKDSTDPNVRKRHLLRLWLATPESEGGWATPFKDTDEKKRVGFRSITPRLDMSSMASSIADRRTSTLAFGHLKSSQRY